MSVGLIRVFEPQTPSEILTSDGFVLSGNYLRNFGLNALPKLNHIASSLNIKFS